MSTPTIDRNATVRQLAETGMSQRAIARQLGIHHNTVARIVRATAEPDEPTSQPDTEPERAAPEPPNEPERASDEPPTPTSGELPQTRLIHNLPKWLIQDLNVLVDPFTSSLPEPVARAIHTAAQQRRATWLANAKRRANQRATGQET